jgi:hypothetical protein
LELERFYYGFSKLEGIKEMDYLIDPVEKGFRKNVHLVWSNRS